MEKIALKLGKALKGTVVGPIKATKDYVKIKITLKKYEKKTDVIPINKLIKKVYKSDSNFVDMISEISNPLVKLFKSTSVNTTDVYIDNNDEPVLSCSYNIKQNLLNKNTFLICNCISTAATIHSDYYYLAACIKYNVVTDQTEIFINSLLTKV